jgi:hypothetical protein
MARLLVHVEGETEETFVNNLLCPYLASRGYDSVSARLLGNARPRFRRGGIKAWSAVQRDIVRHLREDRDCIATTMVDYYALPQAGDRAWPGRAQAAQLSVTLKARAVETALTADLSAEMGAGFSADRFVPFVVLHEFEGLLFSNCDAFARGIGRPELAESFQAIRDQFATPEEINDSPVTAPSKRITELMPHYQKPLSGYRAALEIGLDGIRDECPHFCTWLDRLEALATRP